MQHHHKTLSMCPSHHRALHVPSFPATRFALLPLSVATSALLLLSPLDVSAQEPPQFISDPPSIETKTKFDPQFDPSSLVPLGTVTASALYWWLVIVPSERAALSTSKRRGPLREYLEELRPSSAEDDKGKDRSIERWFYSQYLRSSWFKTRVKPAEDSTPSSNPEPLMSSLPAQ